jgi:hypothetical protein
MEIATKEVISESSENSVENTNASEGNLSMAEFADQLLKSKQPQEELPELTEETDEPAEETAEPTDVLEENSQSVEEEQVEEEESSPPAEPSDVLSKFGIDLDNLSEDESRDLAKALNASAVKRFGRLTAQKKALLAENAELQAKAEEAQQAPTSAELPEFLKDNAFHSINDAQSLQKEVEQLTTLLDWVDEHIDNEVEYDDNGNEYVVKDGDKAYTKSELRRIKASANKTLRKDAPARHKWIQERTQSDQQAMQTFEFLGDERSDSYKLFMQVKESPMYKPLVKYLPNSNFALGLMVEGLNAVKERQGQKAKPAAKPKAPMASTEAGTSRPKTPQANKTKALQAAKAKFDRSGSMTDYQVYLKLRNKT